MTNGQRQMTQNSMLKSWFWGHYSSLGFTVGLIVMALDQLHKWWMLAVVGITASDRLEVTPFFNLVYVSNRGISFGLFQQDGNGQLFLAGFSLIVAIALTVWLARSGDSKLMAISIGLITGGAIGNAIDRLHLGGVADFFDFHVWGYHWPAFNIADTSIVAGAIGLLYDAFVTSRNDAAKDA